MATTNREEYIAGNLAVTFDSKLCIHRGRCLRGLPAVFSLDARPWVNLANATPDEIVSVVSLCPSGALQWRTLDGSRPDSVAAEPVSITLRTDGPSYVRGSVELRDEAGSLLTESHRFALCRCGMSGNKPFCDNSHARNGWHEGGASA